MNLLAALSSTRKLQGIPYAQLNASNYVANAEFGASSAISASGSLVAIGAPKATAGAIVNAGVVYLYDTATVTEVKAFAEAPPAVTRFGASVALSADGNTLAIGVPDGTVGGSALAGYVYVYRKSGTDWVVQAKIVPMNPQYQAGFGESISLSADGNTIAIGAPRHMIGAKYHGRVFVYQYAIKYGTTYYDWNFYTETGPTDAGYDPDHAAFGCSVAINAAGTIVAIGAKGMFVNQANAGAVFVASNLAGSISLQALFSDVPIADGYFGNCVAINAAGDTVFIGEPGSSNPTGVLKSGAAHVMPTSTAWRAKLWHSDPQPYDQLGVAISCDSAGSFFTASATLDDTATQNVGSVFTFSTLAGTWAQQHAFNGVQLEGRFGSSVALSAAGDILVIGAKAETYNGLTAGNAYILV